MNNITADYYTLLDVAKNASAEDIKKSFRLLALRFHPDKNPNDIESEEKFKSISRAYETLSNPQKRMIYDRTGNADYSDMFSSSGGMQGRGGCAGKGGRCGRGRRGGGANFNVHDISLTRKEALEGAAIDIGIIKNGQREMHRVNLPEKIEDGTMLKYSDSSIGADFIIRVVYSD